MDQQITVGLVAFFITAIGAIAGVWWRIEARMEKVKEECKTEAATAHALASIVAQRIADHQLLCAQTYIQKADLKEFRDEIVGRIGDVKVSMDHLSDRMDRVFEQGRQADQPPKPPSRGRAT